VASGTRAATPAEERAALRELMSLTPGRVAMASSIGSVICSAVSAEPAPERTP